MKKLSLRQAARSNITRLRLPNWVNNADYVEIDTMGGEIVGWIKLYSPLNESIGVENPKKLPLFFFDLDKEEWLPWHEELNTLSEDVP